MSIFTVSATELVQLATGAIQPTDTFQNGVLVTTDGATRAISSGGDEYSNGLLMTDAGLVRYVDANAGLPADTVWLNGLPRSGGALCVSTNAAVTYSNGIPFAANGAVAVTGILWTPAALGSNLALWLDANDASTITLNGSTVSQWNDRSGNGRDVSQASAALQPTYSATGMLGRPTLDWGTALNNKSLINATNFSNFSPTRFFVVADYDGPNPATDYFGLLRPNFTSTIDYVALLNINTLDWLANAQFLNGAATASLSAAPILQPFILATSTACSPNRTNLRVGADDDPNRGWRGKISEVIAINFVPTTQERNLIEGYLAWKWGLVANLPAGHPFKNTPPTL